MNTPGVVLLFGLSVIAFAQDVAVAGEAVLEDAKAMALKAADFLRANGPEKAWTAFSTGAEFHDRDLYVTVLDRDCTVKAHGASPILLGQRLCGMQDTDGKPFIWEMTNVIDRAWVDYKWQNPITKAVELKTTYVIRVGEYIVGVGAYKRP